MVKFLDRYVHQSYFVVWFCIGVILGVIVALVWRVELFVSAVWVWLVVGLMAMAYFNPKMGFLAVAMVAGMILAFYRVAEELDGVDYVRNFYGKEVMVSGVVEGDPNVDEMDVKIKVNGLRLGKEEMAVRGSIYMTIRDNIEVQRADEITVLGEMLEGFGVYAGYMYRPRVVEVLRPEPGDMVLGIRNWFAERVRRLMPEPEVSLGLSYLLGMKTGLTKELSENLRVVGLVHMVVASGTHLSILVGVARKIFGRWSRFAGVFFAGLFVVFFMAMVGWTPSILRAGVMALLTLVTWYVGRKIEPWRLVVLVMALTLILNPMYVIDLGWLMSFASYIGITLLGPRLTKFFYGNKKPNYVASMMITTVAATLMTLPITLYYYGMFSLIAVVANLLILPTLPVVMGLTFGVGVMVEAPLVEVVFAWCATKMLQFHIEVVGWFAGMKQFLVEIPMYQWQVFLIYGVIAIMVMAGWVWRRKKVVKNDKYVKI